MNQNNNDNSNNHVKNRGTKVGTRITPSLSSLKADVSRRLRVTAESTEAPLSAAEGILAGLNKNGSMLASVGTRDGMEEVLPIIAPLMAAIEMGKKMVRRHQGLVVTPAMQKDQREIIAWHARTCGAALVDGVYTPTVDPTKTKRQQQTISGMIAKERRLVAKMRACTLHRSASSSTLGSRGSTASPSTRSSASSGSGPSRTSSKMCSFTKETRGVVFFARVARVSPGAAFIPARRPSVRVDPRVSHLSGSAAIRL